MTKPYYEHAGITIYHGDCREILPSLAPVDLVLTDPPYLNLKGGYERVGDGDAKRGAVQSVSVGDLWQANTQWANALPEHLGVVGRVA